MKRAVDAKRVEIHLWDIREYAPGKHRVTDDTPYGGGGGMVMKVEPILLALEAVVGSELIARQKGTGVVETPIILMTPGGDRFTQRMAQGLQSYDRMVLVCGRYEGVDERLIDLAVTHQMSIGDYVLSGGEIAAMVIVEAVTRLVPGVLGDMRAIIDDSHSTGLLEHPHYTRPASYRDLDVPQVLLSGNHAKVARWRREQSLRRTQDRRPDMIESANLSPVDEAFLRNADRPNDEPLDSQEVAEE